MQKIVLQMEQMICQKCGQAVSNDFGVTLSFCTNCGAALQNLNSIETLEFSKKDTEIGKPKNQLLTGIVAGGFLTLLLIGGIYLTINYFSKKQTSDSGASPSSTPFIELPKLNSVSASEITEISIHSWRHNGLLYSGDGYVDSNTVIFRRNATASKIEKKDYDDGKTPDEILEKKSSLTNEQFERIAASIIENDFFSQTDSTERISEGDNSLKIKFTGKEKEIKTSNINKDTPQIKKILNDLKSLEVKLDWMPAK